MDATSIVSISVITKESRNRIVFKARNELTEASALSFLHFMFHLSYEGGSSLSEVRLPRSAAALSWGLIQPDGFVTGSAYKFPRLRAQRIDFAGALDTSEMSAKNLPLISRFFSHCHSLDGLAISDAIALIEMLEMIRRGRGCNTGRLTKVRLMRMHRGETGRQDIYSGSTDSIIDYLRTAPDLRHLPKIFIVPVHGFDWPINCPRVAGQLVRKDGRWETRGYRFTNVPSGEEFSVRLLYDTYTGRFAKLILLC